SASGPRKQSSEPQTQLQSAGETRPLLFLVVQHRPLCSRPTRTQSQTSQEEVIGPLTPGLAKPGFPAQFAKSDLQDKEGLLISRTLELPRAESKHGYRGAASPPTW